jgi:hypothetical protein
MSSLAEPWDPLLVAARRKDGIASCYQPEAAILCPGTTSRGRGKSINQPVTRVKLVLLMRFLFICYCRIRTRRWLFYRFGVRLHLFRL